MRTKGAKDKGKRNLNRKKSYTVFLKDGSSILTQAKNKKEIINKYPNLINYEKLEGYD